MEARARHCSSIKIIFALLTMNILASSTAEYVHRHRHGIQSKTYEHPRFGDSSIRYCAFNQYFDDREGRCLIIPGGGIAIFIDDDTTCSTEALRGHPHSSRNYYICRKSNTILAECGRGKRFENRLKRCTIDALPSIDEEDYDSHHRPYDHLHLPACQRSGRFPVPQDNCTSFYTCTSNGFRFFRSIHKCPASTGFDPFDEICTTERACSDDELGSTTAADDRAEIYQSTTGLIVTTAAERSLDEFPSTHTPRENYSLNKSTTRFTTIMASPSLSASGRDETKISVSFVAPNAFTTETITTATSLPSSIDEVVGIARAARPTTKMYEHGGETSTRYAHSIGSSEETNTSERSLIAVATNHIVDTSTVKPALSDHQSTINTSDKIDGILYNKYADDYVTLRSDNTVSQETKNESSTVATVTISTNTKIDEFTDQTTVDDLRTMKWYETRTSEANELGIGLRVSYSTESAMENLSDKWLFDKNIEGETSTIADEIPRREITERELGSSLAVLLSGAASDATTRDIQYKEGQSITTPSGISSIDRSSGFIEGSDITSAPKRITIYDAVTLTTPVDSYASSGDVSWKSLSSDGMGGSSIGVTEIVDSIPITLTSMTPRNDEATSIKDSNLTTEEESTIADRYHDSFSSFSTDKPDNDMLTTDSAESAMSTTEQTYISEVTEKFDSTPFSPTSLTTRNNEATSIQESNWTTEEESTITDRDHGISRSVSTDTPDNEKSTTADTESAMSTTEQTYISEVTEKFESTPFSPTLLTTRNNEVTSIQESNWTTEEESTIADRYHGSFSSGSTDTPDNQKSSTDDGESAMSTTQPTYITEVTEKVDSTIFSPTLLTTRSNEATSIQESNLTTEEESTIADRYHGSFSSGSTDTPDNEKSTTTDTQSALTTTEPVHISEATETVETHSGIIWKSSSTDDLFTPIELDQSTTGEMSYPQFTYTSPSGASQFDIAHTTEDSASEVNIAVSTSSITPFPSSSSSQLVNGQAEGSYTTLPRTVSSLSIDRPDNDKSPTAGTESATSIAEPVHTSETTEKAAAYSKIDSPDALFTKIQRHQSTTGENLYSAFTYASTLSAYQFGIAQTTADSNPEISVAVSTTSITPSLSSEPSQLEDGQTQGSNTSTLNSSEYQTTVDPSTDATNSLSTTMPPSSD